VVLKGVNACLKGCSRLEVVGEARDGLEAVSQARSLAPDLVLMDLEMPQMNGLEAVETLRKQMPRIKVLMLSAFANPEYLRAAVHSGADGYLLKDAKPEQLIQAIDAIVRGESVFPAPPVPHPASAQAAEPQLSTREREVLILIAEGLTNHQIAARFKLGVRTVETHRQAVMRKLGIHSIAGLTRFAVACGLVAVAEGATR
jgi:DNA-binding NarL/FixJ family response regulator